MERRFHRRKIQRQCEKMWPLTQIIGFGAAAVGSFIMLPQIIHSYRTKHVRDISNIMLGMYSLNNILWLTYGLLISDTPLTITNGIALILMGIQIVLKIRYRDI